MEEKHLHIANPARYYNSVDMLIEDDNLSSDEKINALENWRNDIFLKLNATAENMRGAPGKDNPKFLEEIEHHLHEMRRQNKYNAY